VSAHEEPVVKLEQLATRAIRIIQQCCSVVIPKEYLSYL